MYQSLIGAEQEYAIVNKEGVVVNDADRILDLLSDERFVKEGDHATLEQKTGPVRSIDELAVLEQDAWLTMQRGCAAYGLRAVPTNFLGAGSVAPRESVRYDAYRPIVGDFKDWIANTLNGVHDHIDAIDGRGGDQQRLFTALDPLAIAITQASPIAYDGTNGLHCQRVHAHRRVVYVDEDLLCQLAYLDSEEAIATQDAQRFANWSKRWASKTGKPAEEFAAYGFDPENTGYHTPRKRTIGNGTFENRSKDSTTLIYKLAGLGLFKGANDRMIDQGISVRVAEQDFTYSFSDQELVLPSLATIRAFENDAITYGVTKRVADYLRQASAFASSGLPKQDQRYLLPIAHVMRGNTVSSALMNYMHECGYHGKFTPEQGAQAHLFLHDLDKKHRY